MIPHLVKFIETESRKEVTRGWRKEGMGSDYLMHTGCQFWKDEKIKKMDHGDGCTTM